MGEIAGRAVAREPKEIVARGYDAIALRYAQWAGQVESPVMEWVRDLGARLDDGAAAVLVASERAAGRLGLEPRARFVSFGLSGVDPYRMLHGNPQACEKALARAGLTWDDISVIEVNEAFASVVLQFAHDAGLEERWDDINPNGGGISLGHPLGATGARITATLLNELERRDERYGIATMCIGFGQAIACVVERV